MALNTETTAVTEFARGQLAAAARVAAAAVGVRSDVAPLVPTFGLIGAEFLAAVVLVVDNHARRYDASSAQHASLGDSAHDAARRYGNTDSVAAQSLGVAV